MDKAKETLKEGEILQVNGIVDCSEHGWAVVEEYDKHELAETPMTRSSFIEQSRTQKGKLRLQQPRIKRKRWL